MKEKYFKKAKKEMTSNSINRMVFINISSLLVMCSILSYLSDDEFTALIVYQIFFWLVTILVGVAVVLYLINWEYNDINEKQFILYAEYLQKVDKLKAVREKTEAEEELRQLSSDSSDTCDQQGTISLNALELFTLGAFLFYLKLFIYTIVRLSSYQGINLLSN